MLLAINNCILLHYRFVQHDWERVNNVAIAIFFLPQLLIHNDDILKPSQRDTTATSLVSPPLFATGIASHRIVQSHQPHIICCHSVVTHIIGFRITGEAGHEAKGTAAAMSYNPLGTWNPACCICAFGKCLRRCLIFISTSARPHSSVSDFEKPYSSFNRQHTSHRALY